MDTPAATKESTADSHGDHPAEAQPVLRVRLLGEFDLRVDGSPLPPLESARAESLLAYLLLHREAPQLRQHLAFVLWPDSTEAQARTNLRHVLHNLRRALPDPDRYLEASSRTLGWRPDASVWLDVAAFAEAVARAEREAGAADGGLAALRAAVDLYAGDLLEGRYDEWLLGERERLRQRYLETLERLTALLEARGDHAEAILAAERLLRHDPLREETYRLLMRLHDLRGDRARALHVYHVCATTLERELGVEPSEASRAAYEALLPAAGQPAVVDRTAGRLGGPPLVGRAPERTRLTALWRAAEAGRAQLVLINGEPGIGKTRLVEEFRSWCVHRGAASTEARSYPAEGALAYGPVVAWLRSEALKPRLGRLDRGRLSELARLLPEILSEVPDLARPEPLPESDQRQRLFDAAARAILVSGGPLLLVADDLHWCDRETLQFLHYLLRVEPAARLLVVATARPDEIDRGHPLNDLLAGLRVLERLTEIQLERLTRPETAALAERLAGRPLAEPEVVRLHDETEGNPLFVVEALRAGWTSGQAERGWMSPRVQAAIESRLGRLSEPTRDLVGVAATIGREFTAAVLAEASEVDEEALVRGLDELWRHRIVREQGADAYDFSHDKIREVAYLGLSPVRRRRHHLHVALALERLHGHEPEAVAGQLAAHYERAGAADQAVAWYERAADAAQQLYANAEAIRLLDRGLDLLRALPATPERQARELALLTALPASLWAIEGYSSDRIAELHGRALELAEALGVEPASPLLRSLAIASLSGSQTDFAAAQRFGEQLYARGKRDGDDMLVVESDYVLGIAAFWQGSFVVARRHFEAAVERYRPEQRRMHLIRYGLDPQIICLSRLGNTLWCLGYPEAAARARTAALALADELGHPFSRSTAILFGAMLSLELGDEEALRQATASLGAEFARQLTRPTRLGTEAFAGYLDVLDGRAEAGVARIQRALDEGRGLDVAPGHRAVLTRLLLESCAVAGMPRQGLAATDRALRLANAAPFCEAEAYRLRAEFLAALGEPEEEVETAFGQALEIAHQQGATSFELRAAASLLRRRLQRGDAPGAAQARTVLAAILDRLPEQGQTPDVRRAVALLGQA
jgi:DNA-binding SARP family transcriptional activator